MGVREREYLTWFFQCVLRLAGVCVCERERERERDIVAHNRCWGYLRGAILMHVEAKRISNSLGDRQLQQLWAETKIGDILPWEDVEREAERLLESTRANARDSENSRAKPRKR